MDLGWLCSLVITQHTCGCRVGQFANSIVLFFTCAAYPMVMNRSDQTSTPNKSKVTTTKSYAWMKPFVT